MKDKVQAVLEQIRPALQADITLKMGIEQALKEKVPEVKEVVSVQ